MKLSQIFQCIKPVKILLAGDLIVDTYTFGRAKRISPEAPVAVVHVTSVENRPGGAGNVALNLRSLGAEVVLLARVGSDEPGSCLKEALEKERVQLQGVVIQKQMATPVKNRIIAASQQMVRIDYEEVVPLSEEQERHLIEQLPSLLDGVDVVAISDYGKGFLTKTLLSSLISLARKKKIPVVTDPKGTDFSKYAGSTLLKPNYGEALAVAGLSDEAELEEIAARVVKASSVDSLLITRSEKGISYFPADGERQDYPVKIRAVKDVTGAGDTVLAMLTFAMANGFPISVACQLSNIAAGLAIEVVGCARITLSQLAERLLQEDRENKIFEEDHLFALEEVLRGRACTLLAVEEGKAENLSLFKAICELRHENTALIVLVKEPSELVIHLLAAMKEVDYLVVHGESLGKVARQLEPKNVCLFSNGNLQKIEKASLLV